LQVKKKKRGESTLIVRSLLHWEKREGGDGSGGNIKGSERKKKRKEHSS